MKKMKRIALAFATAALIAPAAVQAEGLELSGSVVTLFGWQHDGTTPATATASCTGNRCNSTADAGVGGGQLGDLRGTQATSRDTFNFYVDAVELDLSKTLGENIRVRADLDMRASQFNGGQGSSFYLEQGYVTANIPVGNGMELLVGRFNIPMGFEAVDRQDNIAVSFSNLYRFVKPHNVTGAKLYYAFNDLVDLHFYVVNNLNDTINVGTVGASDSAIPSGGIRLGFTWGEEGQESTIGLSGAVGPELSGSNTNYTFIGDLDFTLAFTENFTLGGEFIYRQDNTATAAVNNKAMAATLTFAYNFSESWGGYVRGGWLHDINPAGLYTNNDQQIFDATLGFTYEITDGARVKLEYRGDWHKYAGATPKTLSHGVAAAFAYNF